MKWGQLILVKSKWAKFFAFFNESFKRLLIGFKASLGLRYYFVDDLDFTSNYDRLIDYPKIASGFYLSGFLCA